MESSFIKNKVKALKIECSLGTLLLKVSNPEELAELLTKVKRLSRVFEEWELLSFNLRSSIN